MNTIEVECSTCGAKFDKPVGEYNRRMRLKKTEFFCNRSCAGKSPAQKEHLDKIRSGYDISQHSGNARDRFTPFRKFMRACNNRRPGSKSLKGGDGHEVDVDVVYLRSIWLAQEGKCPLSGINMLLVPNGDPVPFQASLDRIDSNVGYIRGNVRFVTLMANYALNKFSDEQLVDFCKAVVDKDLRT
jgi:hypothetical protein